MKRRIFPGPAFRPPLPLTLAAAVMLPVLLGLGFWQLERAGEKALILERQRSRAEQPAVALENLREHGNESLAFRVVTLSGRFLPERHFLLDNRTREGRFGYEVLSLLQSDKVAVLVNRGWLPGDPARRELPSIPPVSGEVEITGRIHVPAGEPYLLQDQTLARGWPKVIQAVELPLLEPVIEAVVGDKLFPYTVRLLPGEPGALRTGWEAVNVTPARHTGYAVQWFALAAALLIYYLFRGLRRDPERSRGTAMEGDVNHD